MMCILTDGLLHRRWMQGISINNYLIKKVWFEMICLYSQCKQTNYIPKLFLELQNIATVWSNKVNQSKLLGKLLGDCL